MWWGGRLPLSQWWGNQGVHNDFVVDPEELYHKVDPKEVHQPMDALTNKPKRRRRRPPPKAKAATAEGTDTESKGDEGKADGG